MNKILITAQHRWSSGATIVVGHTVKTIITGCDDINTVFVQNKKKWDSTAIIRIGNKGALIGYIDIDEIQRVVNRILTQNWLKYTHQQIDSL